ncbi:hypothetical protein O181_073798 [Austropuccinia psidii MF-1]|uniref:Uncharacterized protein n=1 Tax=Austropuccinia psidii MF-1 TaxID=1389203 RepID=A0A9Q3IAE5_9BASI|nr:hypothetical protein [Austropuccinia psidii MF-1]
MEQHRQGYAQSSIGAQPVAVKTQTQTQDACLKSSPWIRRQLVTPRSKVVRFRRPTARDPFASWWRPACTHTDLSLALLILRQILFMSCYRRPGLVGRHPLPATTSTRWISPMLYSGVVRQQSATDSLPPTPVNKTLQPHPEAYHSSSETSVGNNCSHTVHKVVPAQQCVAPNLCQETSKTTKKGKRMSGIKSEDIRSIESVLEECKDPRNRPQSENLQPRLRVARGNSKPVCCEEIVVRYCDEFDFQLPILQLVSHKNSRKKVVILEIKRRLVGIGEGLTTFEAIHDAYKDTVAYFLKGDPLLEHQLLKEGEYVDWSSKSDKRTQEASRPTSKTS